MQPAKHISHHDRYDYQKIWLRSSEAAVHPETLQELLHRFGQLIGETMLIQQVGIWLASEETEVFELAYIDQAPDSSVATTISLKSNSWHRAAFNEIFSVARFSSSAALPEKDIFENLRFDRIVLLARGETPLGIIAIEKPGGRHNPSAEDDEVLLGMSRQLAYSIFSHTVSEELNLARQRDASSTFSSFIVHDLKNVATLQNMTLENAKNLKQDPEFIEDAFTSFTKTTDKLMNLIATLSMRQGQFSPKQKPVNLILLIKSTVEELKIVQRNGVELVTDFPNQERAMTLGDWELLKKAFTNILLNAIQSLPDGKGRIEILVSPKDGQISTAIVDSGCGMPLEQLAKISQPFQTTKERGSGICLCHTRSILTVHCGNCGFIVNWAWGPASKLFCRVYLCDGI